jgi:hypothetical protein
MARDEIADIKGALQAERSRVQNLTYERDDSERNKADLERRLSKTEKVRQKYRSHI